MLYITNQKDNKNIDDFIFKQLEITPIKLMAKAAEGLFNHVNLTVNNFLIFSNGGNNGGDGLALAKLISDYDASKKVHVYICASKATFDATKTPEVAHYYEQLKTLSNVTISFLSDDLDKILLWSEFIIDCIFGMGYHGKMAPEISEIIKKINQVQKYVLACDIPSGIDNDRGTIPTIAIKANKTVTFFTYKTAFINYDIIPYLGEVVVWQLGFHPQAVNDICSQLVNNNLFYSNSVQLHSRPLISHKGTYGNLMIFASSLEYLNAGTLVANMALNAGIGLVIWAVSPEILGKTNNTAPEITFCDSSDRGRILDLLTNKVNIIAYGMGRGKTERTYNTLNYILDNYKGPIVVDADGINVLDLPLLRKLRGRGVLTPHVLELSRLIDKSVEEILQDRVNIAKEFANKYKIIVVLKGYQSIITDGNIVYINGTGNPYMAVAGMGDTLTGLIASLIGQGYELFEAAIIGTYLHGFAGDEISQYKKPVLPTDIIEQIGYVLAELIDSKNDYYNPAK
ncbi:carbohydrate kinase [Spiroplasma sp. NBRC 100390]|uniref:bifunctional ADP-dependent NAD(P)H-hydrate dehydratase/NAD(P)H-hydrate epimerase n=1 Tax=unclassified Spiroplasma TaxID=2637901 RepID=UPI0008927CA0|nr:MULTISPECIES: bifunctional ADP-dependent NAD(P)H-hydrate dehydratase/NAD(P)H-hydrate epimerase [unclassified Spiroplasma]AOX44059.1 carbohydrate kinase [Spiroplasma sp. TU-14]APE13529.1 carbohydrate kinase [Spiroplasma sp. NBRC 100390]